MEWQGYINGEDSLGIVTGCSKQRGKKRGLKKGEYDWSIHTHVWKENNETLKWYKKRRWGSSNKWVEIDQSNL